MSFGVCIEFYNQYIQDFLRFTMCVLFSDYGNFVVNLSLINLNVYFLKDDNGNYYFSEQDYLLNYRGYFIKSSFGELIL